jgi:hypothetical protein
MHFVTLLAGRYDNRKRARTSDWRPTGRQMCLNFDRWPEKHDSQLRTLVRGYFQDKWPERVGTYDVASFWWRFRTLQRCLSVKSFTWLMRRNFSWNKRSWAKGDRHLPVFVHFKGNIIIWNGTHRATLAYLFRRRILATRIDLDAYVKHVNKYGHGKRKRKHS